MKRNARPRPGIFVPRWVLIALATLFVLYAGHRIFTPPSRIVQRLDSPDGRYSARLKQVRDVKNHFAVHVRQGRWWRTVYYSPAMDPDYRVDRGERLQWTPDSKVVLFKLDGLLVWGYSMEEDRSLNRSELDRVNGSL